MRRLLPPLCFVAACGAATPEAAVPRDPLDVRWTLTRAADGRPPRVLSLEGDGGRFAVDGTDWRCRIGPERQEALPSGAPVAVLGVFCERRGRFASIIVSCAARRYARRNRGSLRLDDVDGGELLSLGCRSGEGGAAPPPGPVTRALDLETEAGREALDSGAPGEVPLPEGSGWTCHRQPPVDDALEGVGVRCATGDGAGATAVAACRHDGEAGRFQSFDLGVGTDGVAEVQFQLLCHSYPPETEAAAAAEGPL